MTSNVRFRRTRLAVLWTSLLNEPLWAVYSLFSFILYERLGASTLQIAVLMMLKPVASLLSVYWVSLRKPEKVLSNVIWAGILSRLPFLFFPFIDNVWILVGSAIFYMMLTRGGMPSWVQILKLNLPEKERGVIFSWGSAIGYLEGVVLAVFLGLLLDNFHDAWRWIFPLSAMIGIVGVILQSRIPLELIKVKEGEKSKEFLLAPWKSAWKLLKEEKEFRVFQWGVMLCGMGLMIIQPALPQFFMDVLNLSYTDLAIALSIWKGVGFALTSPLWGQWISRINIFKLSSQIFILMGLFPLFLIFAPTSVFWVYAAYLIYGIAQAGSHLVWNLSGPLFSKEKDSSLFSNVNVLMVGVRGCIFPPLGSFFCAFFGPVAVLGLGGFFCFFGALYLFQKVRRKTVCNNT